MLAYWPNEWSRPSAGSRAPTGSWYGINCSRCTTNDNGAPIVINPKYRVVFDNNCDFVAFETRVHLRELVGDRVGDRVGDCDVDGYCTCCRCVIPPTGARMCVRCHIYVLSIMQMHQAVMNMCAGHGVPRDIVNMIMMLLLRVKWV